MDKETKERFDELERMMIHVHRDVENAISKINEVDRKFIAIGNYDMFGSMKETFTKLEHDFEKQMNCDIEDTRVDVEMYTPINALDEEYYHTCINEAYGYDITSEREAFMHKIMIDSDLDNERFQFI